MKIGACEPIAALNRVKILETGEPLIDIRVACPTLQVVETACPFLRLTVAEMLNNAASRLPASHTFRVGTALRTLSMQRGGWDRYFARMKEEHPAWPLSALRRATNRYFAPYDQKAPPGHCTGGAVDVAILGPDGEPLDVTSPTTGWEAAYTWSDRISEDARRNRMWMVEAMIAAGFSNCREEYWHYSWGDSGWAVRVGESTCPYGFIEPPVCVEAGFTGGIAASIVSEGELTWTVQPATAEDGQSRLAFGLFWAEGKEAKVQLAPPLPDKLFQSPDRKEWEPMLFDVVDGRATLALSSATPRFYIASEIPPESNEG